MATLASERGRGPAFGLRPVHWIMIGIIALALGAGGYSLRGGALVSYASVPEAKAQARHVQVFGYLYSKGHYDEQGRWQFDIQGENGDVLTVVYPHAKPGNFEQAISVVAIGKYDQQAQKFMADQLLVKCPSKYQEQAAIQ
ncbi:MAG: cytochrome c maturation protein CcmE [Chloroflexota bacterium]|nr:cytochrome c maturation protein CcmE [Chloroflexota bacterium]